jgi:hypothetical protein
MQNRELLNEAADALAVATGVSFVASALLQTAIFVFWGLDFTAIASVEDVVMGGIRFLAILVCSVLLLYCLMLAFDSLRVLPPGTRPARYVRGFNLLLGVLLAPIGLDTMYTIDFFSHGASRFLVVVLLVVWIIVVVLATAILTSSYPIREAARRLSEHKPAKRSSIVVAGLGAFSYSLVAYTASYASAEHIDLPDHISLTCREARQDKPTLLWMGSRAMVVDCGSRRNVVVTGESPYKITIDR